MKKNRQTRVDLSEDNPLSMLAMFSHTLPPPYTAPTDLPNPSLSGHVHWTTISSQY